MTNRRSRTVVALATLLLGAETVSAQVVPPILDPWTITIDAESGIFFPIRAFGKDPGELDPLDPDETSVLLPGAKAEESAMVGVGLRLQLPNPAISIRAGFYRTLGAEVIGSTRFGDLRPDNPAFTETFTSEMKVSQVLTRIVFVRRLDQSFRPIINIGVGLRSYHFTDAPCPANLLLQQRFVCERSNDVTKNQTRPVILFGLGAEWTQGSFDIFGQVNDIISGFDTEFSTGTGESQTDLLVSLGIAYHIR